MRCFLGQVCGPLSFPVLWYLILGAQHGSHLVPVHQGWAGAWQGRCRSSYLHPCQLGCRRLQYLGSLLLAESRQGKEGAMAHIPVLGLLVPRPGAWELLWRGNPVASELAAKCLASVRECSLVTLQDGVIPSSF